MHAVERSPDSDMRQLRYGGLSLFWENPESLRKKHGGSRYPAVSDPPSIAQVVLLRLGSHL